MDSNKEKKPFILIRPIVYLLKLDGDELGSLMLWLSLILAVICLSAYIYIHFGILATLLCLSCVFFIVGGFLKLFSY